MSKSLLNFLVQISKALVNSKIRFLIQKSFFFTFGPTTLTGPLGLRPSWHRRPSPSTGRNRLAGPSSPRVGRVFAVNTFSSSVHAFPSRPPPPRFSDNQAPLVSSIFPTVPADPGREPSVSLLPASPAPRLGCRQAFTAPRPLIISPLNTLQTKP
jgi:hypothetical protein